MANQDLIRRTQFEHIIPFDVLNDILKKVQELKGKVFNRKELLTFEVTITEESLNKELKTCGGLSPSEKYDYDVIVAACEVLRVLFRHQEISNS